MGTAIKRVSERNENAWVDKFPEKDRLMEGKALPVSRPWEKRGSLPGRLKDYSMETEK